MTIVIIGLGLIGGSLAKALSQHDEYIVCGLDTDSETMVMALDEGAIAHRATEKDLAHADVIIVALHPQATIDVIRKLWPKLNKNALLLDTCGVKQKIYEGLADVLKSPGPTFIGAHPMAGRELFGFSHSLSTLFDGASLLLTGMDEVKQTDRAIVHALAKDIGFSAVIHTTPEIHDRIIAYTSQLAHVVSSAYIKSPTMLEEAGFSAGSFRDMTRVAKLDEKMWSELFLMNRPALLSEIDELMSNLQALRDAIQNNDRMMLESLLATGREKKEWSNRITQKSERDD